MSIVAVILSLSNANADLTEAQHSKALEYLSLQLSIRDREEIVRVLCRSNPDHLTQAIRDGVSAYEPMIRQVHQAVDLSATVGDFQAFMDDMIKLTKADKKTSGAETSAPSVEDYVRLLHNHMGSCHRFLHQVAKNGKEVTGWFYDYVRQATANFRHEGDQASAPLFKSLITVVNGLSAEEQAAVRGETEAWRKYIDDLHTASAARIKDVIGNKSSTRYGPGAFLARWQGLLDATTITPAQAKGPVRSGADKSVKQEARRDVDGEVTQGGVDVKEADKVVKDVVPEAPKAETTLRVLGPRFRELLTEMHS